MEQKHTPILMTDEEAEDYAEASYREWDRLHPYDPHKELMAALRVNNQLVRALEPFAKFACDDGKAALGCTWHNCNAARALLLAKGET